MKMSHNERCWWPEPLPGGWGPPDPDKSQILGFLLQLATLVDAERLIFITTSGDNQRRLYYFFFSIYVSETYLKNVFFGKKMLHAPINTYQKRLQNYMYTFPQFYLKHIFDVRRYNDTMLMLVSTWVDFCPILYFENCQIQKFK